MKRNIFPLIAFAIAVLVIPMTAMATPSPTLSEDNSSEDQSQSVEQTPNDTAGSEESFKVLDINTNEVVTISASDYIKGVVAAEIPLTYEPEAIKARGCSAYLCPAYETAEPVCNG